jgi:ATP-dependent helicase HrpA
MEKRIKHLSHQLPKALGPDRFPIRRELDRIRQRAKKGEEPENTARALERLSKRLERSTALRRDRVRGVPALSFPEQLPITDKKDEIIEAIRRHPVVIISGETGSGKTTQIPKFCLAAGRGIDGKIGCTQPRRIAAVTVADRIAEELGEAPGKSVGYKIRFHDKTAPEAYVKIMTDGILLAETQSDPRLRGYDTLIVDEAHERSLNIDFLLGILKTLVKKRRDLKLVITSATIDTEKFAKAFDNAPVIEVSGRTFPVEVRWEKGGSKPDTDDGELTPVERAATAVTRIHQESGSGDILVFMPTEQDIRDTMEILEGKKFPGTRVLPLFARLTAADQAKVFSTRAARKIIVATNIAETSLTIPGIKYVVDTGLARVSQYNPRTRTTALPVIDISKSSADQRMGRCGRVQNGVCVRLFSEEDYNARPRFTRPEILRANLAEVILRMISLKLPEISGFPFLDRPPEKAIQDGLDLLMELGAVEPAPKDAAKDAPPYLLTKQGHQMASMPLDPRLSRMLIEAKSEGCLSEVAVIVAALSIQDPRERPMEKAAAADRAHAVFSDPLSDFVSLLNIWNRFHEAAGSGPGTTGRMKRFCTAGFLSFRRMREWRDIHGQILSILKEHKWLTGESPRNPREISGPEKSSGKSEFSTLYGAVHRSILSGFLSNIALRKEGNIYQACKDKQVMIFPGSGLFGKAGAWVMAAEMVETSRLYARSVANIDPAWIEPLAGDRCRRTYFDPHWEKGRGQVVATQQVSLYGLILSADRKVPFGPVAPDQATDIFIRSALLTGEIKGEFPFIAHNLELVETIQGMEDKVRRRDILISEEDLVDFYTGRLSGVFDQRALTHGIKKAGGDRWLRMQEKDLLRYRPDEKEIARFPDNITIGGQRFACAYEFSPGSDADGVTVKIPAAAAPGVPVEDLDWLVPGMLHEKIAALVKGLPKAYRRQLAPVATAIDTITSEMPAFKGALLPALSRFIKSRFRVLIPPAAWTETDLPEHLKMRIALTDHKGKVITAGRDTAILKQTGTAASGKDAFASAKTAHEKENIRQWDFGDLPESVAVRAGGHQWAAFPALVPDKKSGEYVHLRLFLDKAKAAARHRRGVRALCCLLLSKDLKYLKRTLKLSGYHARQAAYAEGPQAMEGAIFEKTVASLFEKNIRTRADFDALLETGASRLVATGETVMASVLSVLDAIHDTRETLFELETKFKTAGHVQTLVGEIRQHLASLVPPSFVSLYDMEKLPHLMRYLQAMAVRARKGAVEFARDRKWCAQIEPFTTTLNILLKSLTPETTDEKRDAVESFFWMLEEYKISLFAQEIKTDGPVSAKRLNKKLGELETMF